MSFRITVTQSCQLRTYSRLCNSFDEAKQYSIELYRNQPAIPIRWCCFDVETGEELEAGDAADFFAIEEFEINQKLTNMKQLTMDFTGSQLAEIGMNAAVQHAERTIPDWSKQAYNFACHYCRTHAKFMAEDMRNASDGIVPEPPHTRAWGGVIRRLLNNGIIRCIGTAKVKNVTAHSANASVWEVVR